MSNRETVTLLLVDDTEWFGATLEVALMTMPDVKVVRAESGVQAWSLLEQHAVAAIVTDLHMADMDGFELIERVRGTAATVAIPIIVVSADSSADAQWRARRLGANSFFVKPCSPAAVRWKLEELLDASHLRDS
ncbi:MAG: response regulator [Acidobacteria bacterium]|nr:response regulator [Acidobacteriota bacterium]